MAKTKALLIFVVTAQLVCDFVFIYANCWFSHAVAHTILNILYVGLPENLVSRVKMYMYASSNVVKV